MYTNVVRVDKWIYGIHSSSSIHEGPRSSFPTPTRPRWTFIAIASSGGSKKKFQGGH